MPAASDELSNVGPLARLLGVRLRRVDLLLVDAMYNEDMRAEAVVCLAVISSQPGISQSDVARLTRRDAATIVGMLNYLEQRGLAARQPSKADKRKHELYLTVAGEAELQRIAGELKAFEDELLADIAPEEIAFLMHLLDKVHASCRAALQRRSGAS